MPRERSSHRLWWVFLAWVLLCLGAESARADNNPECEKLTAENELQLAFKAMQLGCYARAATLMDELLVQWPKPSLKLRYMRALAHWKAGHEERAIALWWDSGCWEEEATAKKKSQIPLDCDVPPSLMRSPSDSMKDAALKRRPVPATVADQRQSAATKQQMTTPPAVSPPRPQPVPGGVTSEQTPRRFVGSRPFWGLIGGGVVLVAAAGLTAGLYLWKKDPADYPGQTFLVGHSTRALAALQLAVMVRF